MSDDARQYGKFMTLEELSDATGANVVWLRRLCRADPPRLPGAAKIGQTWIVDAAAVEAVAGMKYRKHRRDNDRREGG